MSDREQQATPMARRTYFHIGSGEGFYCALPLDRAVRLWTRMNRKREFFPVCPGIWLNPHHVVYVTNMKEKLL